jgi:hypothetical protein
MKPQMLNFSQSKIGQILAPVVHALDVVAETSGYANVVEMSGAISGTSSASLSSATVVEVLQRRMSCRSAKMVR